MASRHQLYLQAVAVLAANDRGGWTAPAKGLYPHQWLWDSCFIAMGLAQINPPRAMRELLSLVRGQWANGMLPSMIYDTALLHRFEAGIWGEWAHAVAGIATSALTQPPILALAVATVAAKLDADERREFLDTMWPHLVAYHAWLYRERDPEGSGLVTLVHPWESGWENSPPWMETLEVVRPDLIPGDFLSGLRGLNPDERASDDEVGRMWSLLRKLRDLDFDSAKMLSKSPVQVQDLAFNSLLIASNRTLESLAASEDYRLPVALKVSFAAAEAALESLWDEPTGQYYSRNRRSGQLIKYSSAQTFVPLYGGVAPTARARALKRHLLRKEDYMTHYPVPSVPLNSPLYDERRYWRGPTWYNLNWLIIRGLEHYGWDDDASHLVRASQQLLSISGFREYYSALTGQGLGAHDFSWTAALYLDLSE